MCSFKDLVDSMENDNNCEVENNENSYEIKKEIKTEIDDEEIKPEINEEEIIFVEDGLVWESQPTDNYVSDSRNAVDPLTSQLQQLQENISDSEQLSYSATLQRIFEIQHNVSRSKGGRFPNLLALQTNSKSKYFQPEQKQYVCSVCGREHIDEASLKKHAQIHSQNRPFGCPDCPSRFNQLVHLQIHRRIHTGERPFACNSCPAKFNRRDRLRSHERLHSGEVPYCCPYCSSSFKSRPKFISHLHFHQQGKGDMRSFSCPKCDAVFAQVTTFAAHCRQHND